MFQPDGGAAGVLGEAFSAVEMAWAAHIGVIAAQSLPESRVLNGGVEASFELGKALHQ